jgi:hypothetical protein
MEQEVGFTKHAAYGGSKPVSRNCRANHKRVKKKYKEFKKEYVSRKQCTVRRLVLLG